MTTTGAIETRYAGCRFRSRLEARWAVFFASLRVPWEYEPQGFVVDGRPYLPDFLLTDCGTWVEVKGDEGELDHGLMLAAAERLPQRNCKQERGPRLLILGPIPEPPAQGDLGWIGIDVSKLWWGEVRDGDRTFACTIERGYWHCECGWQVRGEDPGGRADLCEHLWTFARQCTPGVPGEKVIRDQWWGFGRYHEGKCPRALRETSRPTPVDDGSGDSWLEPSLDVAGGAAAELAAAYRAARSARFEHGERG